MRNPSQATEDGVALYAPNKPVNDYKWTYVHMTINQGRPVVRGAKQ